MNMFLQVFALFLLAGSAAAFSSCSANSYYSSGASACKACPTGAVTDVNDRYAIDACACQCPVNTFMNAGKTECVQCPANSYSAKGSISPSLTTSSATQCVCNANHYGSAARGQQCIACPSNGILAAETVNCSTGTCVLTPTQPTTVASCACPKNTYGSFSSTQNVAYGCTACELGGTTGGAQSGTTCATAGEGCENYTDCSCPAGFYLQARVVDATTGVVTTVGKCMACPAGRTSVAGDNVGRAKCVCNTGTYGAALDATSNVPCASCPSNAGSPVANGVPLNGSTTQANTCVCKAGYYGNAGSGTDSAQTKLCNACGTGRTNTAPTAVGNIASSTCLCPINTYAASGANDNGNGCTPCNAATGKERTTAAAGQTTPAAGQTSITSCKCPVGTWGPNDNSVCTKCTDGSTTNGNAKTLITDCMCKQDWYGNATQKPAAAPTGVTTPLCTACDKCGAIGAQTGATIDTLSTNCQCAKNTYGNGTTCTQCPANSTTVTSTNTSGTNQTLQTACLCLANFYGNAKDHTCTACPNGGILAAQGSSTDATSAINCKCPANTYATDGVSAAGGCTPCAASLVSTFTYSAEGSLSVAACACPANSYRGATACVACPDGSESTGNAASDANSAATVAICFCKANYYGESPSGCTICPNGGTRGAVATTTGCAGKSVVGDCKCPQGSWGVNSVSVTSCTACATGWTTLSYGSTAATQCDRCDADYFGDALIADAANPNRTGCTACPANSSNGGISTAATYVTTTQYVCNCKANFYGNARNSLACNACTACPNDGTLPAQTTRDAANTAGTTKTATDCACPANFWGWNSAVTDDSTSPTVAGSGKCTACPNGSVSVGGALNTLQNVCNCKINFYGEARASTCTQCPGVDPYPAAGTTAATGSMAAEIAIGNPASPATGSDARTVTTGVNVINGVNKFTVASGCTCPANTWGDGTTCTACPANSHAPAGGTGTAPTTQAVCMCNTNYYGDARTGSCTPCPDGRSIIAQTCAGTTIDMCLCPKDKWGAKPTGTNPTTTARTCTHCPTNSWAPAGSETQASCLCKANFYGDATAAATTICQPCKNNGTVAAQTASASKGATDCACPAGSWGTNADAGCTGCANAGATSAGGALSTTKAVCSCGTNKYGSNEDAGCTDCFAATGSAAGTSRTNTVANAKSLNTGIATCVCAANFYGPNTTNTACTACDASRSSAKGSTALTDCKCISVNMWGLNDNSACKNCPANSSMKPNPSCRTFGPDSQALCYCNANYWGNGQVTNTVNADNACQVCPSQPGATIGVLQAQTVDTSTSDATTATNCACPANTYGSNGGTTNSCTACPGTTSTYTSTSAVGSAACTCPAGYYWVATDGNTPAFCKQCPSNATSAVGSNAQSACRCNAGYWGDARTGADAAASGGTAATTRCTLCATGRTSVLQPVTNPVFTNAVCLCPAGKYAKSGANDNNATTEKAGCLDCTARSSSVVGSIAITACRCDANSYGNAAVTGGTCTACATGRSSVAQSTDTIVIATLIASCVCPTGTYATNGLNNNVGGCTDCPAGKTTTNNDNANDANTGNLKVGDCSTCAPNYWGNGNTCTQCPSSYVTVWQGKSCTAAQKTAGLKCGGTSTVPTTQAVCVCPAGLYNIECNSETHNCYGCVASSPTMAPTNAAPTFAPDTPTPPPSNPPPTFAPGSPTPGPTAGAGPAPAPTDSNSKASSGGSSAGAIVGSICGVLVLGGIGYYFYSQKQALAKQAAENATTGLDSNNKI